MRIRCMCGNSITDQTDYLPYKAWFLPDEDTDLAVDYVMTDVQAFIEARERGDEDAYWQANGLPHWRQHTLADKLRNYVVATPNLHLGRAMYECDECGRIWMEARPGSPDLVSYQPESASRGILRHQGAPPDE